ncbi:MAG: 3-isopropylmalate dehydratase small subunit [Nitrososphaerales archaeon]
MAGRAWKFGDNISTDHIAPGRYFHLRSNLDELAKHVLEDARPEFPTNVKKGDFVVAGVNFGLGSSREHAPTIIKRVGVEAVLAKSFARIFYRNAVNIGLPAVICDTSLIDDGDLLTLDLSSGIVLDHTKNVKIRFQPLPDAMKKLLDEGGLIPYVKRFGDLPL